MQTGAITSYIDVAQIALYTFWILFGCLVIYLRKEDKREGYPLVTNREGQYLHGFPVMPKPKVFILKNGRTVQAPCAEPPQPGFNAEPTAVWGGAPMQQVGIGMLSGAGPAASALRTDEPEEMQESSALRIVPLRVVPDHDLDDEGPDPRGKEIFGADGELGGIVTDAWIDRAEMLVRYLEVTLVAGPSVLVPMPLVTVDGRGRAFVQSVLASQFADAPRLANPDQITLREEDRVAAYFASGHLFATPSRQEPLL